MYIGRFLQNCGFISISFVTLADRVAVGTPFADKIVCSVTDSASYFMSDSERNTTGNDLRSLLIISLWAAGECLRALGFFLAKRFEVPMMVVTNTALLTHGATYMS